MLDLTALPLVDLPIDALDNLAARVAAERARRLDLDALSPADLAALHVRVAEAIERRGPGAAAPGAAVVVATGGVPASERAVQVAGGPAAMPMPSTGDAAPLQTGDVARHLFRTAFRWRSGPTPHEAVTGDGRHVVIRSRRVAAIPEAGTFATLRAVDEGAFDLLACAVLGPDGSVLRAVVLTRAEVEARVTADPLTRGWDLSFEAALRLGCGAFDVTARLATVAAPTRPAPRRRVRPSPTLRAQLAQSLEQIGG